MKSIRSALAVLLLPAAIAVAAPRTVHAQSKGRDVISREDIDKSVQKDASIYDVIRTMRPHMLAPPRGARTIGGATTRGITIYVDGVRESGIDVLKSTMAADVIEVRYQDPSAAESEHGSEASGGAIMIKRAKTNAVPKSDKP